MSASNPMNLTGRDNTFLTSMDPMDAARNLGTADSNAKEMNRKNARENRQKI